MVTVNVNSLSALGAATFGFVAGFEWSMGGRGHSR
jgi:hypothetical protein